MTVELDWVHTQTDKDKWIDTSTSSYMLGARQSNPHTCTKRGISIIVHVITITKSCISSCKLQTNIGGFHVDFVAL